MQKKILMALLCGMVSLSMIACGNKDVENVMAKEPIVSETQEPIVNETQEPIVSETQEPIVNETKEPIVSETQEPIVNETQEPIVNETKEPIVNETKEPIVNETKEPIVNETKEPINSEQSSSSSTPSGNDSTKVTQGSTGSTSYGTSYPIVSEFNSIGISSNAASFWSMNDDADEYATAVGEANRALGKAIGSLESTGVAFTLDGTGNIISCGSAWVERQPTKGQYLFVYGVDFTQLVDGGALSREVIKVMLGTSVTSTPIEVESALFEDCFGSYEQFPLDVWVAVGDCEIKFVYSDDTRAEYAIRAKQ